MNEVENKAWLEQNYYTFSTAQIMCFQAVIDRLLKRNSKHISLHNARQQALDAVLKCADF